jgi:hypothetical protein
MKRRTVDQKLEQLEQCNKRLYGFLEKADEIQSSAHHDDSHHRIHIQFVIPLQDIQDNAAKVHRVLHRSWCKDHVSHRAGLLLEQRLLRREKENQRNPPQSVGNGTRFGVSIWRISVSSWLDTEFSLNEVSGDVPR